MENKPLTLVNQAQYFITSEWAFGIDEDSKNTDRYNIFHFYKGFNVDTYENVILQEMIENDPNENAIISKRFLRIIQLYIYIKPYIGIPHFYGYYFAPRKVFIVEQFPNGSLSQFYHKMNKENNEKFKLQWTDTFKSQITFSIACTMMHLHAFHVVHKCLNADFIKFDEEFNAKVTDFVYSKSLLKNENITFSSDYDRLYSSPEIVNNKKSDSKCDVYSFGVILLSIVQGNEDFHFNESDNSFVIPDGTPLLVANIIKCCLYPDPSKRPSFAQIVKTLVDCPNLFPDTDENEYMNTVSKYMENVQTSPHDRSLFRKKTISDEESSESSQMKEDISSSEISTSNEKVNQDNDDEKHEEKIDDEKHETKIDDEKHETKIDDEKHETKIDDEKHETKIDDEKHETKIDDESHEEKIDDEKHETKIDDDSKSNNKEEVMWNDSSDDEVIDTFSKSKSYSFIEDTHLKDILKKAKDGDTYAMVRAGRYIQKGLHGAKIDTAESFNLFKSAAEKGNTIGLFNYATCKKRGIGTEIDIDEAFRSMREAAQPERNNIMAMRTYADWLLDSNADEALQYYLCAMRKGDAHSAYMAAHLLSQKGDIDQAKRLYLEAAENGILIAMNDYSFLMMKSPSTFKEGFLCLKQNAARFCPESNYNLAMIELNGLYNTKVDLISAADHFKMAANLNHPKGCYYYANMLANGDGKVKKNVKKAADYYNKAAKLGVTDAMVKLALLLQKDEADGIKQNLMKAAQLLKTAADKGNKLAMKKYAECLIEGKGVEIDLELAERYTDKF